MSGRVLLGRARDTVPLANAMVVIHHVTRENAGPVDSMRSDARGRYRIELRNPDSSGAYVVSVWYDSLAYV
ncbi:MAG: carboxypeptidase regulatory-like domain-containing protein, partial [Betaproteobacteria bacterium]